jgi:D-alanyl-D-alanine carboxypeptidase (penicillin-binding protein 5/6)
VLSAALLLSPATASAKCLSTDQIAGVPLEDSGLHDVAPDVGATSGVVVGNDDRVLWARGAGGRRAIASVTKIMTALLVLENASLEETVTVSEKASRVSYATGLKAGEELSVRQLLELALVTSSNDAATALAEHVGGSVSGFAEMMNERAEELGLDETRFVNPHGLDASGHYSCATEIATLAHVAMQDPEFARIVMLEEVTLGAYEDRAEREIESTDELLGEYEGLLGVKTGFTDDAKYCFVSAAERDGITLTTVVLGSPNTKARFNDTSRLLDWGFEHLTMRQLSATTETIGAVPITINPVHDVTIGFDVTTATPVFDLEGEVTRTVTVNESVDLPIYTGQPLGEARLVQGDEVLATVPVVATEDVASAEETIGTVPVSDYLDVAVTVRATSEELDVPHFDPEVVVTREVILDPEVKAPVREGYELGRIVYSQGDEAILTVPVVAASDVEAPEMLERVGIWFERTWNWITGEPTMATLQLVEP